ncbi:MAG: ABC transporter substrate-binding protein, partial [Marivita sp.]
MSTFIKDFIEEAKIDRRNFLFASAAGLTSAAIPGAFGRGMAMADSGGWSLAWSYRDRASAYWNAIVSGG